MEPEKVIYNIWTEFNLSAYKSFHDFEWARTSAPDYTGKAIDFPFTQLLLRWFHISEHFRFPEVMMLALKGAYKGALEHSNFPITFMSGLKYRLQHDFCPSLTITKGQELIKLLTDIESSLAEVDFKVDEEFDMDSTFERLVRGNQGYAIGLGHSISQSFCSIYFAYEHFVKRCFQLLGGDKDKRVNAKFHDVFKKLLNNDALYEDVWTCDSVRAARDIRSAIVHSDGELEPSDSEYPQYHNTHERRIMVHTDGVRRLYNDLKERAVKLADYLATKPI